MRDGVRLATDVYLPDGPGPWPTVLIRTQYDRTDEWQVTEARNFAGQGFAVVVQDVRGLFGSEGLFVLGGHDALDGFDSMTWIEQQAWSNGRVGTYGCSSLGINQILLAKLGHPAHSCAIAQASGGASASSGNRYTYWDVRRGGAVEIGWSATWFFRDCAKDRTVRPKPTKDVAAAALWSLPIADIIDRLGGAPTDWRDYVSREPNDPWWDQFGFLQEADRVDVPTLFVTSWYDTGPGEVIDQYRHFRRMSTPPISDQHRVIISPALHCGSETLAKNALVGERSMGDARLDYWSIYLGWFGSWLRDSPPAADPAVRYFHMGRNQWRQSHTWPPPDVVLRDLFLRSGGNASTRNGDGRLEVEASLNHEPADQITYDPSNPVPSLGQGAGGPLIALGPRDHAAIELRPDVLCYTSEILADGLDVTGPVKAILYVSSSALDTDFTAKLLDVEPGGRAIDVVEGVLRARYRTGFDRPRMMETGHVYEIEIDLQATSLFFAPGHRIRLEVSSSNFPRFDRNLNTGGRNWDETEWTIAINTVHHSNEYPSRLVLPISSPA